MSVDAELTPGPVLVREWRDGRVQAMHTGHAVVLDAQGATRGAWGRPGQATYWRSAAKPLQAVPFVATGAMEAFGLGEAHLAVACGSHDAEPGHVAMAREILAAARLTEAALRCGVHDPGTLAGPRPATGWSAIHNNCSGKHAAMLATCVHMGWPTDTYLDAQHPLQVSIRATVAAATGDEPMWGIDGCGLPTFWASLHDLATALRWLDRDASGRRVLDAMGRYPFMLSGTQGADTALGSATQGRIVSKYGALGVVAALNRQTGEALGVKTDAGVAVPAKAVALAIMQHAGWLSEAEAEALTPHLRPPVRNHAGRLLGHIACDLAPA